MTGKPSHAGSPEQRGHFCAATLLSLLFAVVASSNARAQPEIKPTALYGEVTRLLEPWIAAEIKQKGIPALSIALVDDQTIVWARGFGFADSAKRVPATAETVYRVGSVSKLFTDLAVMQLFEQGKIDLDAPVTRYVPDFAPKNPYGDAITLRHLMSHRSGLVREPPVGHYFDPAPPSLDEVIKSLSRTTLVFKPGTRTKYSNAGIAVVGSALEKVAKEPFAAVIDRSLLKPLRMSRSSFEPGPELQAQMANGMMWTYDGQTIATPTFLLGTGPAGNLVSTVVDLGRFLSFIIAGGASVQGHLIRSETLLSMIEPQPAKPGEPPGFGLGFAISDFRKHRQIGHGGAVYGFATEVKALPDSKLGVIVIASADCANGFAQHVAATALRLMLGKGQRLEAPRSTLPVPPASLRELTGRFSKGEESVEVFARAGKLYLSPFNRAQTVEIRSMPDSGFMVDDRLAAGSHLSISKSELVIHNTGTAYAKQPAAKPAESPAGWRDLIGEYGWDHDVLYILEKDGKLHALIEWFFDYPLIEDGPDRFRFPSYGLYADESVIFHRDEHAKIKEAEAASVTFVRRKLDGEDGNVFRIKPVRSVDRLAAEADRASPPAEAGEFAKPDLVELTAMDPSIKLDIRYATTNNFLSVPVYKVAKAVMQRPAAEALVRAHQALAKQGYGLLIHDAYRPWRVTKIFWDAVPESGKIFVADPSKGSKHNRGCAVDLTLYDRASGKSVKMVGGYDEFSPRSYPDYPGGTRSERWHRDLLRKAMEAEGFTVFEFEWWHFDFRDWAKYPILNLPFEEIR
jgi:CubicO group peptidase (beta-lactamase class C family)/D-alanyl-D-alanine dipeptidase